MAYVAFARPWRLALAALVALVLAACAALDPAASPVHTPHATLHPQVAEVEAVLSERFGMEWTAAGPHHRLGQVDGVQVDLVGAPIEQVVVSLPLEDARDPAAALAAYLRPIAETLEPGEGLIPWTSETLDVWDRDRPLRAEAAIDGLSVRMTASGEPPYLVLVVTHEDR